ncbi:glycosyltransferase family 2 protein [Sesbania bispinosa]|nr:glycosyltransferase family 2 protein [Sesbania bispinosa]
MKDKQSTWGGWEEGADMVTAARLGRRHNEQRTVASSGVDDDSSESRDGRQRTQGWRHV